jgi:hypothetical protein
VTRHGFYSATRNACATGFAGDGANIFALYLRGICIILRIFAPCKCLISRVIPRYSTKFHSEKIILFSTDPPSPGYDATSAHRWTRIGEGKGIAFGKGGGAHGAAFAEATACQGGAPYQPLQFRRFSEVFGAVL